MKKNYFWPMLIGLLGLLCPARARAQASVADLVPDSTDTRYRAIDLNLTLKNMHLWRGFKVTNAAMAAADLHYTTRDGHFRTGVWGGSGFTGEYREFDYYASYSKGRFLVALWDINNFSSYPDANIFSYDQAGTSHFADLTVAYTLSDKLPLRVSWSTILLGRDYYTEADGRVKSTFSNYVQLDYPVWHKGSASLSLLAGGAFAFGRQQSFYAAHPNFTNLGGVYARTLQLGTYEVPVAATALWNPEKKYGALQVAVTLF